MMELHDDIDIIIMTNGMLVKMNSEIEKLVFSLHFSAVDISLNNSF